MPKKSIAEIRKQEIIEHFYAVIISEGFENASMGKVAKRMEVHSSLLIHYYSNKEEMILALIDFMVERYEQTYLPLLAETGSSEERIQLVLDSLFSATWDELTDSSCFYSIYPLLLFKESVKGKFQELYHKFSTVLMDEISLAIQAGVIPPKDPLLTARVLITMLEGANFYGNILDDAEQNQQLLAALKQEAQHMLNR
ncbi:MAG: TetR/AcrR family transcriptional regulator [Bacteroidota bacterium]